MDIVQTMLVSNLLASILNVISEIRITARTVCMICRMRILFDCSVEISFDLDPRLHRRRWRTAHHPWRCSLPYEKRLLMMTRMWMTTKIYKPMWLALLVPFSFFFVLSSIQDWLTHPYNYNFYYTKNCLYYFTIYKSL